MSTLFTHPQRLALIRSRSFVSRRRMGMKRRRGVLTLFGAATAMWVLSVSHAVVQSQGGATEAPAAFDNRTNGLLSQADFDAARATFEERDEVADGLGPVYNAQSCAECHQSPVTGAGSQISELRAAHRDSTGNFVDAPGDRKSVA